MNFEYTSIVSAEPGTSDFIILRRPEIPLRVRGVNGEQSYVGLVDTGADNTILPKSVADALGIQLQHSAAPSATVFGGDRVELLTGDAILTIESDGESITWKTQVCFFEFGNDDEETILLGFAGFLEYFTAVFDGHECTLALLPNDDLPIT